MPWDQKQVLVDHPGEHGISFSQPGKPSANVARLLRCHHLD